mgnify:CR=1 FL=1
MLLTYSRCRSGTGLLHSLSRSNSRATTIIRALSGTLRQLLHLIFARALVYGNYVVSEVLRANTLIEQGNYDEGFYSTAAPGPAIDHKRLSVSSDTGFPFLPRRASPGEAALGAAGVSGNRSLFDSMDPTTLSRVGVEYVRHLIDVVHQRMPVITSDAVIDRDLLASISFFCYEIIKLSWIPQTSGMNSGGAPGTGSLHSSMTETHLGGPPSSSVSLDGDLGSGGGGSESSPGQHPVITVLSAEQPLDSNVMPQYFAAGNPSGAGTSASVSSIVTVTSASLPPPATPTRSSTAAQLVPLYGNTGALAPLWTGALRMMGYLLKYRLDGMLEVLVATPSKGDPAAPSFNLLDEGFDKLLGGEHQELLDWIAHDLTVVDSTFDQHVSKPYRAVQSVLLNQRKKTLEEVHRTFVLDLRRQTDLKLSLSNDWRAQLFHIRHVLSVCAHTKALHQMQYLHMYHERAYTVHSRWMDMNAELQHQRAFSAASLSSGQLGGSSSSDGTALIAAPPKDSGIWRGSDADVDAPYTLHVVLGSNLVVRDVWLQTNSVGATDSSAPQFGSGDSAPTRMRMDLSDPTTWALRQRWRLDSSEGPLRFRRRLVREGLWPRQLPLLPPLVPLDDDDKIRRDRASLALQAKSASALLAAHQAKMRAAEVAGAGTAMTTSPVETPVEAVSTLPAPTSTAGFESPRVTVEAGTELPLHVPPTIPENAEIAPTDTEAPTHHTPPVQAAGSTGSADTGRSPHVSFDSPTVPSPSADEAVAQGPPGLPRPASVPSTVGVTGAAKSTRVMSENLLASTASSPTLSLAANTGRAASAGLLNSNDVVMSPSQPRRMRQYTRSHLRTARQIAASLGLHVRTLSVSHLAAAAADDNEDAPDVSVLDGGAVAVAVLPLDTEDNAEEKQKLIEDRPASPHAILTDSAPCVPAASLSLGASLAEAQRKFGLRARSPLADFLSSTRAVTPSPAVPLLSSMLDPRRRLFDGAVTSGGAVAPASSTVAAFDTPADDAEPDTAVEAGADGSLPQNKEALPHLLDEEKLRLQLEPSDQILFHFNCIRISGLDEVPGVLLLCSNHVYLIDYYQITANGEIIELEEDDSLAVSENAFRFYVAPLGDQGKSEQQPQSVAELRVVPSQYYPHGASRHRIWNGASDGEGTSFAWHECRKWSYLDVRECHKRRYLLRPSALELFFDDGSNFLLVVNLQQRDLIYTELVQMCPMILQSHGQLLTTLNSLFSRNDLTRQASMTGPAGGVSSAAEGSSRSHLKSITVRWQEGLVSNFEYLMALNSFAGRTRNDLQQYPVFPWVLADYDSPTLNLGDPATFRDLRKPMGALSSKRAQSFRDRYVDSQVHSDLRPDGEPRFHYGTHYTSPAVVLFYLLRMEPFTEHAIKLQSGRFDHPDRMFQSVQAAWLSASERSSSDVKELIPEFYYLAEFLQNGNQLGLGVGQNGTPVNHVQLPAWSKGSYREFIRLHRQALESEYVSANLHHWIDLIFGYKQQGPAAVDALNVFSFYSYAGLIDIDSITDPMQRAATIERIRSFGQTPRQLFTKPHPKRRRMPDAGDLLLTSLLPRFEAEFKPVAEEMKAFSSDHVTIRPAAVGQILSADAFGGPVTASNRCVLLSVAKPVSVVERVLMLHL